MKDQVGDILIKIGVTGILVGMVSATFLLLAGFGDLVDPPIFRWFMGVSFIMGFAGTSLLSKRSSLSQKTELE